MNPRCRPARSSRSSRSSQLARCVVVSCRDDEVERATLNSANASSDRDCIVRYFLPLTLKIFATGRVQSRDGRLPRVSGRRPLCRAHVPYAEVDPRDLALFQLNAFRRVRSGWPRVTSSRVSVKSRTADGRAPVLTGPVERCCMSSSQERDCCERAPSNAGAVPIRVMRDGFRHPCRLPPLTHVPVNGSSPPQASGRSDAAKYPFRRKPDRGHRVQFVGWSGSRRIGRWGMPSSTYSGPVGV